jgi:hypothetical protein
MSKVDAEDPEHPILPNTWEYEIIGFNLQLTGSPPRINLTLRRHERRCPSAT